MCGQGAPSDSRQLSCLPNSYFQPDPLASVCGCQQGMWGGGRGDVSTPAPAMRVQDLWSAWDVCGELPHLPELPLKSWLVCWSLPWPYLDLSLRLAELRPLCSLANGITSLADSAPYLMSLACSGSEAVGFLSWPTPWLNCCIVRSWGQGDRSRRSRTAVGLHCAGLTWSSVLFRKKHFCLCMAFIDYQSAELVVLRFCLASEVVFRKRIYRPPHFADTAFPLEVFWVSPCVRPCPGPWASHTMCFNQLLLDCS